MVLEIKNKLFGQEDVRETVTTSSGTFVYSIAPGVFDARNEDDNFENRGEQTTPNADNISFVAPVQLPHNAVITAAVVYGADTAQTWNFTRTILNGISQDTLASANASTEDTSISNPTVDNNTYGYFFELTGWDTGDDIYGARIKYTIPETD